MVLWNDPEVISVLDGVVRSDRDSNGHPSFDVSKRGLLERRLESAIVNPKIMNEHVRFLVGSLDRFRHVDLLAEEEEKQVLAGGLGALSESSLARFCINPIGLYGFRDAVEHELPDFWIEVIEKDGVAMLKTLSFDRHGIPRIKGVGTGLGEPLSVSDALGFVMQIASDINQQEHEEYREEARALEPWDEDDLLEGER